MATPITHLAYTEKVYKRLFSDKDEAEFYRGICYPDIRFLKGNNLLVRIFTHTNANFNLIRIITGKGNLNIHKAQRVNSFKAGLAFHSIIDNALRDRFLKNDLEILGIKAHPIAFKFLQDELLYKKIDGISRYIESLKEISKGESNIIFDKLAVEKWHGVLANYFNSEPTEKTRREFALALGFPGNLMEMIEKEIKVLKKKKEVIDLINYYYDNLEKYLEL